MAFQNLRAGSTVYAFTKSASPQFEIGQVVADPEVRTKYPTVQPIPGQGFAAPPPFMPNQQEKVVKLSVKFGEKIQPIDGLSPIADIQDCGNGLFLSCSREAINAEVISYKQLSDSALAPSVLDTHKHISERCAQILSEINPEVAERQRLEQENKKLRDELQAIRTETGDVKQMLTTLLNQLGDSSSVDSVQNK